MLNESNAASEMMDTPRTADLVAAPPDGHDEFFGRARGSKRSKKS